MTGVAIEVDLYTLDYTFIYPNGERRLVPYHIVRKCTSGSIVREVHDTYDYRDDKWKRPQISAK